MKRTISLKKNELFLQVYKKGKRSYHKNFTLHYLPNGLDYNRLGIKTGKKLAGAVGRNRIRRLVKESYRLLEPEFKCGFDLIFASKEGSLNADSLAETMAAVRHLMKCARLLHAPAKTSVAPVDGHSSAATEGAKETDVSI
ncbi:MAG: ribonuclease P protein component [Ruminococcaceae bacterium]|nr:ribonuclease P protein component [Oscillospiraceae bacterium]